MPLWFDPLEPCLALAISPITAGTAGCYLTLAGLLIVRWRRVRTAHPHSRRDQPRHAVWLVLAIAVALMGINAATNGFERIADLGRTLTDAAGWYEHRRPVQGVVCMLIGVLAVLLIAHIVRDGCSVRGGIRQRRRAAVAALLSALLAFAAVRSISLHQIDALMNIRVGPFAAHHMVEMGMLLLLAIVCLLPPNPGLRVAASRTGVSPDELQSAG